MNKHILFPRTSVAVLCAAGLLSLAGCKKEAVQSSESSNPRPTNASRSAVPMAAAEPKLSAGDQAWRDFAKMMQDPPVPAAWKTNEPSETEMKAFRGNFAGKAADSVKDFYTRFPEHAMAAAARQQELQLLGMAVENGQTNRLAALLALEETRLKDTNMSEDERLQLRVGQVQRSVISRQGDDMGPALEAMEKGVRTLQKEFPKRQELAGLLLGVAQGRLENNEAEKSRALAQEAQASELEEIKEGAAALLKKIERVGQPLKIQFTAVDGREVDLQKLQGKVVLVDFWATWCIPCMEELPKVKATYSKLHEKGFEIVGISLDKNAEALDRVLKKEAMTWPQYLEEAGQENKFAGEFGIEGIPTMWLVDKTGVLRDLNARTGLSNKVEKLLAE
ncbi:MAG TPA: TlpA disulfide reductase family protein [Verrucomicrobiae bacterium]|jgi:thiol-disulfide isomerase/thioredoxin